MLRALDVAIKTGDRIDPFTIAGLYTISTSDEETSEVKQIALGIIESVDLLPLIKESSEAVRFSSAVVEIERLKLIGLLRGVSRVLARIVEGEVPIPEEKLAAIRELSQGIRETIEAAESISLQPII